MYVHSKTQQFQVALLFIISQHGSAVSVGMVEVVFFIETNTRAIVRRGVSMCVRACMRVRCAGIQGPTPQ